MRFLDVAAGCGALSIPAARLSAQVLATDQSAAMLEPLGARASGDGLKVETRVMDVMRSSWTTTASTWPDRSAEGDQRDGASLGRAAVCLLSPLGIRGRSSSSAS